MRRPVRIGRPRAGNSARTGAALAGALLCSVWVQPALAQFVSTTGDIYTTNSTPLSSPTWTVGISGTDELVVGYPTLGTMLVGDGGQVINGNGYVGYIGAGAVTVRGSHPVSGDASIWSNSGFLMVGDQGGTGILNIEQGGLVRASEVTIGSGSSSNGTINLLGDALSGRGVIETSRINAGNGTAALVINGGVLRTTADGSFLNNFILPISIGSEGVWFDSNGHIMAVSPTFTGSGTFNKIGAGTVNLTGNSSGFGGTTIIEAGTLQFSGTSGFIAGNILNDSILSFNRSNALAISSVISGTGSVQQIGSGTTTLTGVNTYIGGTEIDGGTLALSGSGSLASSGAVSLGAAGTFDIAGASGFRTIGSLSGAAGSNVVLGANTLTLGNAANTAFNGAISGTGGLTKEGSGIFTLGGANTFGGTTTVNGGTVALTGTMISSLYLATAGTGFDISGAAGDRSIGALSGVAGTTVALGSNDLGFGDAASSVFAGVIGGTGGVVKAGSGTATFTGASSYQGGTTINAGTLALSSGGSLSVSGFVSLAAGTNFDISGASGDRSIGDLDGAAGSTVMLGANTLTLGDTGTTSFAGAISGAGGIVKRGTGTFELTGANNYNGATVVNDGTFVVNGSIVSGTTVNLGATLAGIGTLGATTIAAGGVHAPGNSIGVQTINGPYVNRGVLLIEATPVAADQLVVNGTVDIAGATLELLLSPTAAASWPPLSGPFIIIANDAADAVAGTFATGPKNLLFLTGIVNYAGGDGNDVDLSLVRNDVGFASAGNTANQRATATGIEALGPGNPLWNTIAFTTDADLVRATFDALSGEAHASLRGALLENSTVYSASMADRLRSAFGSVPTSTTPILAYGPGGAELSAPDGGDLAIWGQALGGWRSLDGNGNAAGIDTGMAGILVGADSLAGDWRLGLMAGYGQSSSSIDARWSSGKSDDFVVGLYGGTEWGDLAVRTGLAYSRHGITTTRRVPLLGETLSAAYGAGTVQAFGELGYGFELGGSTELEAYANLTYARTDSEAFTETGGAAALSVAANATEAAFTTIGLRTSTKMAWGETLATLSGALGWRHAFANDPSTFNSFAGGPGFTITGAPVTRDSVVVEAGLDLNLSASATLGINYGGQFAAAMQDHSIRARLAVGF